jgi:hypothetical protein
MPIRHKSIKVLPHEKKLLIELYLKWRTPIEQFESRPDDLTQFTREWNKLSGRNDAESGVLHYMRTQRKQGFWVRLDGNHRPAPKLPVISAEDTEILVALFEEHVSILGSGSDIVAYEDGIADLLMKKFRAQTGRRLKKNELITKLTALRKRGQLPKAVKQPEDGAFSDINEVG